MIIYNVTINVDDSIHEEWVHWMQETHMPDMLKTGKFTGALMTKVLVEEELGGTTYSIQYRCPDKARLEAYYKEDAPHLRGDSKRFEGKFVAFRTELQIIKEL